MAIYGLTVNGFVPKTFEILVAEVNAALQDAFGKSLDLVGGPLSKLVGIICERYAELWELAEAAVNAQNPDGATDAAQDAVSALTGTIRRPATKSAVVLTLCGTPTTVVPALSRAQVTSTGKKFETVSSATITALTAWVLTTAYTVGQRRTNAARCYEVITAGTSAGAGGPTTTAADIVDNTVHWKYIGEGTGAIDTASQCIETGPIVAVSLDVSTIDTPVGGWSSVLNLHDADLGQDVESNEDLRERRELELSQAGSGTPDAIRAELLEKVSGIISVTIFVNDTDITDPDGVPPHAIECLVRGGADADVAQTIFDNVAAGIATFGSTSVVVVDDEGANHTIKFSRPTLIDIWVDVILVKEAVSYPADGDAQVKAAIVLFGDAQKCGKNVVASSVSAQAFKVAGVLDVTTLEIGLSNPPTLSVTLPIAVRELAVFDTSRITVVTSNGTP